MPLVQAAQNKRELLKTVAALGLAMVAVAALFGVFVGSPASLLAGTVSSRSAMSHIMQPTLVATGLLMIVVGLADLGLLRWPWSNRHAAWSTTAAADGTDPRRYYRRAVVTGIAMATTFGLICPRPVYVGLLVYVAMMGSPLYGALALGTYGLGMASAVVVGGLLLRPACHIARLNAWLASREEALQLVQGLVFATLGTMTVTFFGLRYVVVPS